MKQVPVAQKPIKNGLISVKPLRLCKTLEFAQLNERRLGNTLGLDVLEDTCECDLKSFDAKIDLCQNYLLFVSCPNFFSSLERTQTMHT